MNNAGFNRAIRLISMGILPLMSFGVSQEIRNPKPRADWNCGGHQIRRDDEVARLKAGLNSGRYIAGLVD